jgi:hypothetical protein
VSVPPPATLQDNVADCPAVIVEGLAVNETIVGGEPGGGTGFGLITWSTYPPKSVVQYQP